MCSVRSAADRSCFLPSLSLPSPLSYEYIGADLAGPQLGFAGSPALRAARG